MTTDALDLERAVGERLQAFLGDDNLFYDRFLTAKIRQGVDGCGPILFLYPHHSKLAKQSVVGLDLKLFTEYNGRLYCLTVDEAVIVMAVEQFQPDLEVLRY